MSRVARPRNLTEPSGSADVHEEVELTPDGRRIFDRHQQARLPRPPCRHVEFDDLPRRPLCKRDEDAAAHGSRTRDGALPDNPEVDPRDDPDGDQS